MELKMRFGLDDEYHLQFANPDIDEDEFDRDVKKLLKGVFDKRSPLEYDDHRVATCDGHQVAQVRFKLSTQGITDNYTVESAGKELCDKIFLPKNKQWLMCVTDQCIFGVSAVCTTWNDWFTTSFFNAGLVQGPSLLNELKDNFTTSYVPTWVTVLSIAVFTGLNCTVFLGPVATGFDVLRGVAALYGPEGGKAAGDILLRLMGKKKDKFNATELEKLWKTNNQIFHSKLESTRNVLEKYAIAKMSDSDSTVTVQLRKSLFELAEYAAEMVTSNEHVLTHLRVKREELQLDLIKSGAGVGVSMFALASAFWTTTEVTFAIAPLATWGIADFFGVALGAGMPMVMETTTFLWWCPPLAIAAAAGGIGYSIFAIKKHKQKKAVEQQQQYHEGVKSLLLQAWGIAADTDKLLGWVHCVNGADTSNVRFTNPQAKKEWQEFIDKLSKGNATAEQRTPNFTVAYLQEQRATLGRLQGKLKEVENKLTFPK